MRCSIHNYDRTCVSRHGFGGDTGRLTLTKGIRVTDDSTVEVERGPIEMVPHWVLFHPELSALAIRLYLALRRHADAKGDCFPSRQRLAKLLGVSVPTLDRARKQLVAVGAITMRQRRATDDRWLTTLYRVHWHPSNDSLPTPWQESFQAGNETDALTHTHLSTQTKDQDLDHVASAGPVGSTGASKAEHPARVPAGAAKPRRVARGTAFDEFWRVYPRKVGKRAAREAYEQATREAEPAAILAGAQRYAADPNREAQYTPHPTTWLRQGRWEDDPLPPRKGTPTGGARRPHRPDSAR